MLSPNDSAFLATKVLAEFPHSSVFVCLDTNMYKILFSLFLLFIFSKRFHALFEVDLPVMAADSKSSRTGMVRKRQIWLNPPTKDSEFNQFGSVEPRPPSVITGFDVPCVSHCASSVKKNNSLSCSTLKAFAYCLQSCPQAKFSRYVSYHIQRYYDTYCQLSSDLDGFAEYANRVQNCEKKLHHADGRYLPTELWKRCLLTSRPQATAELCSVFGECFIKHMLPRLRELCRQVDDFYEFELKSNLALQQNVFSRSRVTPKSCLALYDVPN